MLSTNGLKLNHKLLDDAARSGILGTVCGVANCFAVRDDNWLGVLQSLVIGWLTRSLQISLRLF